MAFNETFSDLRRRRRIPMRLLEEKANVSRSYIYGIEQGKLLPSPEKLKKLAEVFVSVADEQEAADPERDARKLIHEREKAAVTERLGFDSKLADPLVSLNHFSARQQADLALPLSEALKLFRKLGAKERSALGPFIKEFVDFYDVLDAETQRDVVIKIYKAIYEVRQETESKKAKGKADGRSAKSGDQPRAKSPKVTAG